MNNGNQMGALGVKLLSTFHLNVPERRTLPTEGVPFSEIVNAVEAQLAKDGWFPKRLESGQSIGEGATIELRGHEIWLHEQHEIGVGRYSEIGSRRMSSVGDAIKAFVQAVGGSPIDGVPIDWSN